MSLRSYVCVNCLKKFLAFKSEEFERLPMEEKCKDGFYHFFDELPNNPSVVHRTDVYMNEPLIDAYMSMHELNRILNLEVRREKELRAYQEYVNSR